MLGFETTMYGRFRSAWIRFARRIGSRDRVKLAEERRERSLSGGRPCLSVRQSIIQGGPPCQASSPTRRHEIDCSLDQVSQAERVLLVLRQGQDVNILNTERVMVFPPCRPSQCRPAQVSGEAANDDRRVPRPCQGSDDAHDGILVSARKGVWFAEEVHGDTGFVLSRPDRRARDWRWGQWSFETPPTARAHLVQAMEVTAGHGQRSGSH